LTMRAMFVGYLVIVLGGLALMLAAGLAHR